MKKLISFIAITILLIVAVTVEQIYINNSFSTLIQKLDSLNEQVTVSEKVNIEQIQNAADDIENYWNNIENVLCITINYNDLQRIGEQLQRVKAYIKQDQKDDCVAELEVLMFFAKNYKKIFEINFSNIF